jgi:hypothetical protein
MLRNQWPAWAGIRMPVSSLPLIARYLGVSIEELIGEPPSPGRQEARPHPEDPADRAHPAPTQGPAAHGHGDRRGPRSARPLKGEAAMQAKVRSSTSSVPSSSCAGTGCCWMPSSPPSTQSPPSASTNRCAATAKSSSSTIRPSLRSSQPSVNSWASPNPSADRSGSPPIWRRSRSVRRRN